jgi:XapX domain-containing protein
MKIAIGLSIGAGCRVFYVPVPSPPTLVSFSSLQSWSAT